jgi:hypothetical protein
MRLEDEMKLLKEKVELLEKIKELQEMIDKYHTALVGKGGDTMETGQHYNWFMIMISWDCDADKDAIIKFQWVYNYLNVYNTDQWKLLRDDDLRKAIDFDSLKALNLIGQRKFVIIGRTTSNKVLQEISSNITLETGIRVDVFPATYVHEFAKVNIHRFERIKAAEIKNI